MAGGNLDVRSSNFLGLENDDESLGSNFVDARVEPVSNNPYLNSSKVKLKTRTTYTQFYKKSKAKQKP